MMNLTEKRVLVAGGTGNVGRHLVQALIAAGAAVVVPSRTPEKLEALGRTLEPGERERLVPVVGDIGDRNDATRILEQVGPLDGAVASLGGFVAAPSVLDAPQSDLERALQGYLLAHLAVARTVVPALLERGGGYVTINGLLAFEPAFPGTGLVSIASAAQAMLARVLMKENADTPIRINELVLYSSFGWGNDDENLVTGSDIGRYVAYLLSDAGRGVRGETVHLRSRDAIPPQAIPPDVSPPEA